MTFSDIVVIAGEEVSGSFIQHFKKCIAQVGARMVKTASAKKHTYAEGKTLTEFEGRYFSILFGIKTYSLEVGNIAVLEMDQDQWLDLINKEKRDALANPNQETDWMDITDDDES